MISLPRLEEQLRHLPQDQFDIVLEVHNLVAKVCPAAAERLDRKGITYYNPNRGGPVRAGICQILFEPDHLKLAFIHGACIPDPRHLLHGETYPKRFMVLDGYDQIPWEDVAALIAAHAAFDPLNLPQNQAKN